MSDQQDELREPLKRLHRDLIKAASGMTIEQARYTVDLYYQIQDFRIAAAHQTRPVKKPKKDEEGKIPCPVCNDESAGDQDAVLCPRCGGEGLIIETPDDTPMEEPVSLVQWVTISFSTIEKAIKSSLDKFSDAQPLGQWCKSIWGIGPVLTSGLIAHIDIERAPVAGHIWSFAGLNPEMVWEKGQKRPFNARLKTLCWKIGQSFMKTSTNENDIYGHVYQQRKKLEWENNLKGKFWEQADKAALRKFKPESDALIWYEGRLPKTIVDDGFFEMNLAQRQARVRKLAMDKRDVTKGVKMLPPGHIDARARRYAVKLFLAHYHHVAYELHYKKAPPKPYIIEHGGHVHFIAPPNWPINK